MQRAWLFGVVVVSVGCSGGTPPAGDVAPEASHVSASSAQAIGSSSAPSAGQPTLKAVACQALIDLPKLQPYFHLELPERNKTLAIVRGSACDGESLTKTGAKVTFVDAKTPDAKFALEILEFVVGSDTSRVMASFRLEGEGVLGQAVIEVKGDQATIVRETVAEK